MRNYYLEFEPGELEDDTDYSADVLIEILNQIPSNTYLYMGCYVDQLFADQRMLGLLEYEIPLDKSYRIYDRRFKLTSECKQYLKNNLHINYESFFCHYMIKDDEKIYLLVFDSYSFDLDASLSLPDKLIQDCEKEEIYIRFSNPVIL